jgi:5-methylcytosine-specific restriction endonuclease McrA
VSSHRKRAIKAGTPATLTVREWAEAISYFNNKCGYCNKKPYQVLEHYLPLSRLGGTTADNCIPACASCNSKKGSIHPNDLGKIFPSDNLARIREYLASVAMKQSA